MGLSEVVAARMELQEVPASTGRECGLCPERYVLHMLDGSAASARVVQADPLLKRGTDNSKERVWHFV